ncbi:MAG: fibronectin type III domain-containing protein [Methanomassiliicoccales archaeon]
MAVFVLLLLLGGLFTIPVESTNVASTTSTTSDEYAETTVESIADQFGAEPAYNMNQTLSDQAQLNTIAFDALAFLTGNLGADSFFPPGKVADFWGFQYLRDNDLGKMGHNTDFLTKAANNMLLVLNDSQRAQLISLAKAQVEDIDQYALDRFVPIDSFGRLLTGDVPENSDGLDLGAVMQYSAELYQLDGQISLERAEVMGDILHSLSAEQRAYLDTMQGTGMLEWPDVADQIDKRTLTHDEHVAVMTYAGDLLSWFLGSVEADVYFCPERQGTYFGSFYLKDAPAMGNANYTIDETLTGNSGASFLKALSAAQAKLITDLVAIQKPYLLEIVELRSSVSEQLRHYIAGAAADGTDVLNAMERYGELDGAIVYNLATAFAEVNRTLSSAQRDTMAAMRSQLGVSVPTGAFMYSEPVAMPDIPNTDFLFAAATSFTAPGAPSALLGTPGNAAVILNWTAPTSDGGAPIDFYIVYQDGMDVRHTTTTGTTVSSLSNGQEYSFTVAAHNAAGIGTSSQPWTAMPHTVAGAPARLTAIPGDSKVALSWTAPSNNGGSTIDYYIIYQDGVEVARTSSTGASISGLKNGQRYAFTVVAHNVAGIGALTTACLSTPSAATGTPTLLIATPGNAKVTLTWLAPMTYGKSIDYYIVYQDGVEVAHTKYSTATIAHLTNGHIYKFSIAAHSLAGMSEKTAPVYMAPCTQPGAPTKLTAIPGDSKVLLTWTAPSSNGGSIIDHYIVYRDGIEVARTSSTGATISGLENGNRYTFTVVAHNVAGIGPRCAVVSAIPQIVHGPVP